MTVLVFGDRIFRIFSVYVAVYIIEPLRLFRGFRCTSLVYVGGVQKRHEF